MSKLRWQSVAFYGWMFVFYNIERLHEPINLASFIYPLATAVALPIILVRWFHKRPAWMLLAALAPVVLLIKAAFGYEVLGSTLPLTVTELGAVALTVLLAHQIGRSLEEFYEAVATATCVRWTDRALPFTEGQAEIYREIRRARRFHRPLTLLTISATAESVQLSLGRLIKEVQELTARQYAMARIGDLLSAETKDCDIITYRDGKFVALLPETRRDQVTELAERLTGAAQQKLGIKLKIGACSFPDDEVTFVELLQRAEGEMEGRILSLQESEPAETAARDAERLKEPGADEFPADDAATDVAATKEAAMEEAATDESAADEPAAWDESPDDERLVDARSERRAMAVASGNGKPR